MRRQIKATPGSDRGRDDIMNIMSSLQIVNTKISDYLDRRSVDLGGGTPSPRTFMLRQVQKYVKLGISICKGALSKDQ